MSGQILWGKFAVYTGLIMAGGWGLMRWSIPSEQQFYDSLSPELKRKMDEVKAQRAGKNEMRDKLEAAGASGEIVWAEDPKPNSGFGGTRRV